MKNYSQIKKYGNICASGFCKIEFAAVLNNTRNQEIIKTTFIAKYTLLFIIFVGT